MQIFLLGRSFLETFQNSDEFLLVPHVFDFLKDVQWRRTGASDVYNLKIKNNVISQGYFKNLQSV